MLTSSQIATLAALDRRYGGGLSLEYQSGILVVDGAPEEIAIDADGNELELGGPTGREEWVPRPSEEDVSA